MRTTYNRLRILALGALLLLSSTAVHAQTPVSGRITDAEGNPVPGVFVMVPGTNRATTTDVDGAYSLPVNPGETIQYECLGLKTITQVFDGKRSRLDFSMMEDATFLDETIVVGYGTQKKASLTSAVSAIKGDELLTAPSTNVSQLLAGKLTGLSSVQESGEPGVDQASLRIRGSVSGVTYVVDGFPVSDINDINPQDVESVSVLKDGASAAVYGLNATGGVIIITTKKGERGKAKITYNGSFGVSLNANFPEFMDGPEFAYYYNMAEMMDQLANGTIASEYDYVPFFTQENIAAMTNGDPTDGWDNVDYIKKVYGTGVNKKHNITVQGGNDDARYFVSAGFMDQKGNIDGYNFKRYNLRSNIESRIAKDFLFTLGLNGVMTNRQTPRFASGGSDSEYGYEVGWFSVTHQTIGMHPYLPETYEGYYTGAKATNQDYPYSPLAALYESGYQKTRAFQGGANTSLTWYIPWVKGLSAKISGSFDYGSSYYKNLSTPYSVKWGVVSSGTISYTDKTDPSDVSQGNLLSEGSYYSQGLIGQTGLYYVNTFGLHSIDAMALMEWRDTKTNNLLATAQNIPFALLPEISNGKATSDPVDGYSYHSRNQGFVFRLRYNYDEKYLAEVSGRYDGSYLFAGMAKTRWGFFPSASLGWRVSKEDFMKNITWINDLKLRASVGLLGTDSVPSSFMFLSTYSQAGTNVVYPAPTGSTINPTFYTSGIANTSLTWEKTLSWDAGLDITMWNGLLGAEVDAFYNYTYDMITANGGSYPSSMGGNYPTYINYNAMDSKGIDIQLTHRNSFHLLGDPFYYGATATMTYAKARWVKYQDDPNIEEWKKVTGTTVGAISGWIAEGLYTSEEEIDNSAWYGTRPNVGDIKYKDLNGDGKIDWNDRGIFGRSNRPELTFGLNLNFQWKNIDFNAQFTGGALFDVSLTGTYFNGYDDNTIWTQTFKEGGNSPLFLVQNAYSLDNTTNATFPRLTLGNTGHGGDNGLSSSFWWRDGKYVRLKSLQIGYTLPKAWTSKIGLQNIRVFAEGQNLFTIDGLPAGIDPESPGVNNGYYPQQKLLMGGITITL